MLAHVGDLHLPPLGVFWRIGAGTASLAGAEAGQPMLGSGGWIWERPSPPAWGEGPLGLPSGSDRQPLEPEFFLEGVQLVQSWLGPGALVGQKGSY